MVKTEITDNICLVGISTESRDKTSAGIIKAALTEGGVFPIFMSRSSIFTPTEKLTIAIDSEDMFPLMNVLGSIRHTANIKNYSINCSNSMIKWENKNPESIGKLCEDSRDIKFLYVWEDKGICFCESSCVNRVCAELA